MFKSEMCICLFQENDLLALQPIFHIAGISKLSQKENNKKGQILPSSLEGNLNPDLNLG